MTRLSASLENHLHLAILVMALHPPPAPRNAQTAASAHSEFSKLRIANLTTLSSLVHWASERQHMVLNLARDEFCHADQLRDLLVHKATNCSPCKHCRECRFCIYDTEHCNLEQTWCSQQHRQYPSVMTHLAHCGPLPFRHLEPISPCTAFNSYRTEITTYETARSKPQQRTTDEDRRNPERNRTSSSTAESFTCAIQTTSCVPCGNIMHIAATTFH